MRAVPPNLDRAVVVAVLALIAAGCAGGGKAPDLSRQTTGAAAWKPVLDDFSDDGSVNEPHACAAVRVAIAHVPNGMIYTDRTLGGAERRYCS